jgi:hypothetical protein
MAFEHVFAIFFGLCCALYVVVVNWKVQITKLPILYFSWPLVLWVQIFSTICSPLPSSYILLPLLCQTKFSTSQKDEKYSFIFFNIRFKISEAR